MSNRVDIQEEIVVIFHAAVLGRTDILQNALAAIKAKGSYSSAQVASVLSMSRPEDGATPLHLAANFGHSDVIRALLNAGADLTVRPSHGEFKNKRAYELGNDTVKQAFHVYFFEQVAMGNVNMIQQLFQGGLPRDLRDGSKLEDSALHWATSFGNLEVLCILLLNGCDIDYCNAEGSSPLHVACKNGFIDLVRVLLEEGANVALIDNKGQSPLAVTSKSEILMLLENPPEVAMTLRNRAQKLQLEASYDSNNNGFASASDLLAAAAADEKDHNEDPHQLGAVSQSLDSIFFDDETDFEVDPAHHHGNGSSNEESDILLVFWPPVQHQQRLPHQSGLELHGQENLFIAVSNSETDMLPLLYSSGLLDALDLLGLLVQVRRNAKGAKLRLVVDKMLCPVQHGYSLKITSAQAAIVAHDTIGLQYGIQTLLQVIHLHSVVSKDEGGIAMITIPAISIDDWPSIPVRAVLRSYRRDIRSSTAGQLQREVDLLSRLRISRLMVILDNDEAKDDVSSVGKTSLLEACQQHNLEVIPTLTLSSLGDGLPLDTLKAFASPMIALILVLDIESCRQELTALSEGKVSLREYCIGQCQSMLKEASTVGVMSIQLSCPVWYEKMADPPTIAASLGLSLALVNNNTFLPPVLFTRPLLAVQQHVGLLAKHVQRLELEKECLAVLPAMTERDVAYPPILLKFFLFVYAGLAWNRVSAADMLGLSPSEDEHQSNEDYDGSIIREVLRLVLFASSSSDSQINNASSSKVGLQTIVTLLTTNWRSLCSHALGSDHIDAVSPGVKNNTLPELEEIAQAERLLWQLVGLTDDRQVFPLPSRRAAGHCLRLYRRVLTLAQWKPQRNFSNFMQLQQGQGSFLDFLGMGSTTTVTAAFYGYKLNGNIGSNGKQSPVQNLSTTEILILEMDEFFTAVHMLCGLCKVALQASAAYQRCSSNQQFMMNRSNLNMLTDEDIEEDGIAMGVPYQQLLRALPAGARSDLANGLLESLGQYSGMWHQRYSPRFYATLHFVSSQILLLDKSQGDENDGDMIATARDVARRYLLQAEPRPPVLAVLQLLCEGLSVPQTLQGYLGHIFSR